MAVCLAVVVVATGCGPRANPGPESLSSRRKTSWDHFGTMCSVVVYDDFTAPSAVLRFESAWQEVYDMFSELERTISVAITGSDIHRFNSARYGDAVPISELTAVIVKEAMDMFELTRGAYNPAVMLLVDLWGFSPRFSRAASPGEILSYDRTRNPDGSFPLPHPDYVAAFRQLSDFSGVVLSGDGVNGYYLHKKLPDVEVNGITYSLQIDLGGIGKGYAAKAAEGILRRNGYEHGFVSVGLSSLQLLKRDVSDPGAPEPKMWAVNVANPDNPQERFVTGFGRDAGVSTSGTYFARYYLEGREYSHIIDPYTGEPSEMDVASATIIGGNASYIDALTTALCVMGSERAAEFMNDHLGEYQVILVVRNGDALELVTNIPKGNYIAY